MSNPESNEWRTFPNDGAVDFILKGKCNDQKSNLETSVKINMFTPHDSWPEYFNFILSIGESFFENSDYFLTIVI